MKLHQLPNGNWIDLSMVCEVTAIPSPDVVVVKGAHDTCHTIACPSYEEACKVRDDIARLVNTATQTVVLVREHPNGDTRKGPGTDSAKPLPEVPPCCTSEYNKAPF